MKKHDELVEETRLLWCEECINGPQRYDYHPELGEACETGAEDFCNERARKCIALILSAVRDGMPLPGEVGRREWNVDMMIMPDGEMWGIPKGSIIIALRPLSGAGKEEER